MVPERGHGRLAHVHQFARRACAPCPAIPPTTGGTRTPCPRAGWNTGRPPGWSCSCASRSGSGRAPRAGPGSRRDRSASRQCVMAAAPRASLRISRPISAAGTQADRGEHAEAPAHVLRDRECAVVLLLARARTDRRGLRWSRRRCGRCSFFPSACSSHSRTIRNVATVSAVPPDFAITTTSVLRGFMESSAAWTKNGSTLSRITRRGCAGDERALHRMRAADAAIECPCAQRAAADADHADGVVSCRARIRPTCGRALISSGLKRQVREAVEAVLALLPEGGQRLLGGGPVPRHFFARDSVFFADHGGQQIGLVKLDVHGCSQSE